MVYPSPDVEPLTEPATYDRLVSVERAGHLISDGALLLWRTPGLIATAGRGIHSHAGKLASWHGRWVVLEIREWYGGRIRPLAAHVRECPGRIDVFEPNAGLRWPNYNRWASLRKMVDLCGSDYGWGNLFMAALRHLPFVRLRVPANVNDAESSSLPPFCSQAVAIAERHGGVDPVPYLPDRLTEPADLARSSFYQYRCTLAGVE